MKDLLGKKVLVTGGTHGIGQSISLKFAEAGASVAFLSRSEKNLSAQILLHDARQESNASIFDDA